MWYTCHFGIGSGNFIIFYHLLHLHQLNPLNPEKNENYSRTSKSKNNLRSMFPSLNSIFPYIPDFFSQKPYASKRKRENHRREIASCCVRERGRSRWVVVKEREIATVQWRWRYSWWPAYRRWRWEETNGDGVADLKVGTVVVEKAKESETLLLSLLCYFCIFCWLFVIEMSLVWVFIIEIRNLLFSIWFEFDSATNWCLLYVFISHFDFVH